MHVRINGEPLEEVYCFKYLGSQVAADGGYTLNERGYRTCMSSTEKYAEQ